MRWAGSGSDMDRVRELIHEMGLQDTVQLLGDVEDVSSLYEQCGVVVLSSHFEGQPYTIIEAMTHGRPVVATDLPGVREILGPFSPDLCVAPGDPHAFADAIGRVLSNRDFYCRLSHSLYGRAKQHYSIEAWVTSLLDSYARWLPGTAPEDSN